MSINYYDSAHRARFLTYLSRMKRADCYHLPVAYLMALANLVPEDVFDFKEDVIRHSGINAAWQTSSSRKATRLAFNLWNGWAYEEDDPYARKPSTSYSVDNIFCNWEFAPYFWEAVRLRFFPVDLDDLFEAQ